MSAEDKDGRRWLPFVTKGKPRERRAVPIHAYVGPNGAGKSLAAVYDSLPSLDAGRSVLSTVRLLDFRNLRPCEDLACLSPSHGMAAHYAAHPRFIPFVDFRQLLDIEHCDVLMDEVTGVADAREFGSMPVQVRNFLVQLRRRDVVLRWTTPAWAFGDVTIRRVTQAVTVCSAYLPVSASDGSMWRDRRLFVWRTYDARDLDDFDSHKSEKLRSYVRQGFWRPGSVAESAYTSKDSVLSLGALNDAGICMDCGGKRSHPRCSCDRHPAARYDLAVNRPQAVGADEAAPESTIPQVSSLSIGLDDSSDTWQNGHLSAPVPSTSSGDNPWHLPA